MNNLLAADNRNLRLAKGSIKWFSGVSQILF
jgi:hypothetical protein